MIHDEWALNLLITDVTETLLSVGTGLQTEDACGTIVLRSTTATQITLAG